MSELEGRRPQIRDDSRVRILTLATKARQALGLPAKAIDWPKLYDKVYHEYAQGRAESEVDWENIVADCKLENPATHATLKWMAGLAAAVIVLGSVVFAWYQETRYRTLDKRLKLLTVKQETQYGTLDRQFKLLTVTVDVLKQQNDLLQQKNEALQKQVEKVAAFQEETRQLVATTQKKLEQRIVQLQREDEALKTLIAQFTTQPRLLLALQDTQEVVTVDSKGTVLLAGEVMLPSSPSQAVFDFVTRGTVTGSPDMTQLRGEATRGELRSIRSAKQKKPVPISPVLTAVRSTTPTLRWKATHGTQKYQVTISNSNDEIIWQGHAGTQPQVAVPTDILQHGWVYFWQVEVFMDEQSRLSPIVGFWVLDMETLSEVEAAELSYPNSALVLASVYKAHGLHEEALVQLERLADMNPTSPLVQVMLNNVRRQLGRVEG